MSVFHMLLVAATESRASIISDCAGSGLEVTVSEHSVSSQVSDLSAAEQRHPFPSRWDLPNGLISPRMRASRSFRPSHPSLAQGETFWRV